MSSGKFWHGHELILANYQRGIAAFIWGDYEILKISLLDTSLKNTTYILQTYLTEHDKLRWFFVINTTAYYGIYRVKTMEITKITFSMMCFIYHRIWKEWTLSLEWRLETTLQFYVHSIKCTIVARVLVTGPIITRYSTELSHENSGASFTHCSRRVHHKIIFS